MIIALRVIVIAVWTIYCVIRTIDAVKATRAKRKHAELYVLFSAVVWIGVFFMLANLVLALGL